ncbi:hypothetical protein HU200_047917 [Digitaria exilis]|uniref:RING-type E3 ubiquitin transferase n=1 Tax=Digitaria exilis TaxID=1010633 RepID=A0A835ATW6_9POAL|nr:hypothetical protein HU200_047917 [Digitaria exilis]
MVHVGSKLREMDEEEVHIAVGKNLRKEKANILWAAANFPKAAIVLVHVHWPSKWMPFMGGKVLYKFADEKEKEMHRGRETKAMVTMLSEYKNMCGTRKVSAHYLTHDDTVAGVVNLVKKLKIKRIVIGSSNDHLEHSGNIGYGGSSDILASIHELGEESDGYITPPSDLADEIMDLEESIEMDDSELVTEDETLTEQGTEESIASDQMENFAEEDADQSDEIQTPLIYFGQEEIDRLQKKLKELQEGHNYDLRSLSPRQKLAASQKRKSLSEPRYPELQIPENIEQFSTSQIGKATEHFHSRNFIGEGGYGQVYKGKLGGTPVAIKLLKPHGRQGFPEYQQEVLLLSKLEHPHIVRLMGVCPESCSLVYEHLPNGTLLERLSKGLLWKDRVRILAEQLSAGVSPLEAPPCHHPCRPEADQHPPGCQQRESTGGLWDGEGGAREAA